MRSPEFQAMAPRGQSSSQRKRAYGTDEYWIERHARVVANEVGADDETTEWLLDASQLAPLLEDLLPRDAAIVDIGCGTSTLALDLLRDTIAGDDGRALAIDIAPAAIAALADERRARLRQGEASAKRAEFLCADLTRPSAAWREASRGGFDASFDKSTTDGMLCDTRLGAQRVRELYRAVGGALRPRAMVVVISWRAPDDGLEFITDVVLAGLVAARPEDPAFWSIDIHSIGTEGGGNTSTPHIYVLSKRPRRVLRRRAMGRASSNGGGGMAEQVASMTVRQHWHAPA